MAYSKLYKVERDCIVGYQTINQGRDNLDYVYDSMAAEHGVDEGLLSYAGPTRPNTRNKVIALGHHDTPKIARDAVHCTVDATLNTVTISPNAPNAISSITRVSAGVYKAAINNLALFWGRAVSFTTGVPVILCEKVEGDGAPYLKLSAYASAATLDPADPDEFDLFVFGTHA